MTIDSPHSVLETSRRLSEALEDSEIRLSIRPRLSGEIVRDHVRVNRGGGVEFVGRLVPSGTASRLEGKLMGATYVQLVALWFWAFSVLGVGLGIAFGSWTGFLWMVGLAAGIAGVGFFLHRLGRAGLRAAEDLLVAEIRELLDRDDR